MTADGVQFHYFEASAVRIDQVSPLGGPAAGGTLVTLTGAGYHDRGGVYCRFGSNPASQSSVPATLHSSTELSCTSPPHASVGATGAPSIAGGDVAMSLTLHAAHWRCG